MKNLKKLLALVMILTLSLSNIAFADINEAESLFDDFDNLWGDIETFYDFDDSDFSDITIYDFYEEINYRDLFETMDADLESIINEFFNSTEFEADFDVLFDESEDIPNFMTGFKSKDKVKSKSKSEDFLNESKELFGVIDGSYRIIEELTDNLGMTHYKLQQTIDGIDVYGGEMIVHTDENDQVYAINGNSIKDLKSKKYGKQFKLSEADSLEIAMATLDFDITEDTFLSEPTAEKFVYKLKNNYHPVYLVTLEFIDPYAANMKLFINAKNGKIVDSYDALADADGPTTGTGIGVQGDSKEINTYLYQGQYYLYDTTKSALNGQIKTYDANNGGDSSLPGSLVTDSDNNFNSTDQKAAVDAHYYAGLSYDYYYDVHGRNSYDGNGASIISSVHYLNNENNAFWTGSQMCYGDGDGNVFSPLSGSLDVVAHELTHAVTQHSANLEYRSQSGALNESFSDVFGVIIEYKEYNESDWWRLGEDVYTPNTPGDALRDMKTPTLYNQPDHMNDYKTLPETREGDWGGVHINSGIPNRAFYTVATDIGFDKSGKIYYRALTNYLTSSSQFTDARNALLQSAKDLYGMNSAEYVSVGNAYAAVGIGDYINTTPELKTASVSVDQATNTGSYTVTMTVPANNNATSVVLKEDGTTVDTHSFSAGQSSSQTFNKAFTGKAPGTYTYTAVVSDGSNTLTSNSVNVTVTDTSSGTWTTESLSYDTAHNYTNNYDNTVYYTKEGATKIGLHFSYFRTEQDYDYVYVMDKNDNVIHTLTGNNDDTWVEVDGDTIKLRLVTDAYVTDWGYRLDQGKYFK